MQPLDYYNPESTALFPDELSELALDELFSESYDLWRRIEAEKMETAVEQ